MTNPADHLTDALGYMLSSSIAQLAKDIDAQIMGLYAEARGESVEVRGFINIAGTTIPRGEPPQDFREWKGWPIWTVDGAQVGTIKAVLRHDYPVDATLCLIESEFTKRKVCWVRLRNIRRVTKSPGRNGNVIESEFCFTGLIGHDLNAHGNMGPEWTVNVQGATS